VVNDLRALMRENVAAPPPEHLDLDALVTAGRGRVRRRRTTVVGGAAALTAAVVTAAALALPDGTTASDDDAAGRPTPDAPTITLADATTAVEGRDYEVLTTYTNEDLDADNGQYLDGVTEDGLVLFRDGPRAEQLYSRFALLDPATERRSWLPDLRIGQAQTWPVELSAERLVLLSQGGSGTGALRAYVFDRAAGRWSTVTWPDLAGAEPWAARMGPDGRLYVTTPYTQGEVPEGGWPTQEGGDAEDADAEGDTFRLWSVSLTDPDDVRDEKLTVGSIAFAEDALVYTDSTNGAAGLVHVRDLATGAEHSFDPRSGGRCNLLSFGASGDRIVMSQYCGTYGDVRDDRVQILSTDGDQVVTLQDNGVEGGIATTGSNDVVTITGYDRQHGGAYVYDLGTDRFLRVSRATSNYAIGGPAPQGEFMWHTPENNRRGAKQWVGSLLPEAG
jgi:hypothetical protein